MRPFRPGRETHEIATLQRVLTVGRDRDWKLIGRLVGGSLVPLVAFFVLSYAYDVRWCTSDGGRFPDGRRGAFCGFLGFRESVFPDYGLIWWAWVLAPAVVYVGGAIPALRARSAAEALAATAASLAVALTELILPALFAS